MTKKTEQAYLKIRKLIEKESTKLKQDEYNDLVGELWAHIRTRQECISDEEEGQL